MKRYILLLVVGLAMVAQAGDQRFTRAEQITKAQDQKATLDEWDRAYASWLNLTNNSDFAIVADNSLATNIAGVAQARAYIKDLAGVMQREWNIVRVLMKKEARK